MSYGKLMLLAVGMMGGMAYPCVAQVPKGKVPSGAAEAVVSYHGLVPGVDNHEKVRKVMGEPFYEGFWYNYKIYYHSQGRPDLIDVVQLHGKNPGDLIGDIESASIPEGLEMGAKIRAKLGEPEFELRMATWILFDYSEKGVRFALSPDDKTIGVVYIPRGTVRVHSGERHLLDISKLRQGPQPKPANPAKPENLKVGVSEVVFSPTGPDWLGPMQKFAVHDDLKARTAVFSDGKVTVALVGADLFGAGWDDLNVIREAAKKIGVDNTIIGMAHNHAGGDTIGVYGFYPKEYVAHVQQQIIQGITEAHDKMQPVAELRVASKEMPMDGGRVIGLIRNARNPGIIDPTINLIQATGADGKPIVTLVNFACHVESLMLGAKEISADFPGYMCDQMKSDGLGQAIFLNGALGGMVSGDNKARTHESSKEMGLQLAAIVKDLAKSAQPPAKFNFSAETRRVEIPMTNPNFIPLYKRGIRKLYGGRVLTDMQYIRLGEAQIVTLPGELLPEVSYEILEKMEGFPRILVGLANDELGYMIPPYDFREDSYEETMSQGPATAPIVRDTAIRMVTGIK